MSVLESVLANWIAMETIDLFFSNHRQSIPSREPIWHIAYVAAYHRDISPGILSLIIRTICIESELILNLKSDVFEVIYIFEIQLTMLYNVMRPLV